MTLLAALDRFVHATRLDLLTPYGRPHPRNLRWLPLLALAAVVGGYVLLVGTANGGGSPKLAFGGAVLFFLGFTAANLVRLFGPRLVGADLPLDERELMLKARAESVAGMIVTALAMLGCFYGGYAAVFGTWMPRATVEWVYLGLGFQAAAFALPVWVASWMQPKPDLEDEL